MVGLAEWVGEVVGRPWEDMVSVWVGVSDKRVVFV